jgi:LmbE family N-acetylglucosaminyl deacetylase
MEFVNFRRGVRGAGLDVVFPGWRSGEAVAFYSPHDDDAVLGAGYLIRAVIAGGGKPLVAVFCRGDAGYSTPEAKACIVALRREETVRAYAELGVPAANLSFFDVPDFGLMDRLGRGDAPDSLFDRLIIYLRRHGVSRIVCSSGNFEHWDHTAAFYAGVYTSPQAGDPILADLGPPSPIRTLLQYAVWSDFASAPDRPAPAADLAVLGSAEDEDAVRRALAAFASQGLILARTVAALRDQRRTADGFLELYQEFNLRRPIDYRPYAEALQSCRRI